MFENNLDVVNAWCVASKVPDKINRQRKCNGLIVRIKMGKSTEFIVRKSCLNITIQPPHLVGAVY